MGVVTDPLLRAAVAQLIVLLQNYQTEIIQAMGLGIFLISAVHALKLLHQFILYRIHYSLLMRNDICFSSDGSRKRRAEYSELLPPAWRSTRHPRPRDVEGSAGEG